MSYTASLSFDEIADQVGEANEELVQKVIQQMFDEIVSKTPVRTGTLRDGWEIGTDQIFNDVSYAGFIERGTPYISPVGMVETTIANIDNIIAQNVV